MKGKEFAKTEGTGKEVVILAAQEVFVRRDGAGVIRPMSMRLTLKKGRDTYMVSGKTHISHLGYQACNVIANLSIMRPNTIFVDAVERSNPYIERNPITQEAVNVHARSLAIGFAPTGNPVIVDKTVILNLRQYFLTDLKTKINKFPEAGFFGAGQMNMPTPGAWYSKDGKREIAPRENAVMRFMPTNEITLGDYVGYWFDVAHPEIIAVYEQQRTRQQFAERNAISMSSRNAMSEHPCMPVKDCTADVNPKTGDAVVLVHGYRHDFTADALKGLAQAAADGDLSGVQKRGGAEAELHDTGRETIIIEDAEVEEDIAAQEAAEPEKDKKTTKKRESKKKSGGKPESETQTGGKEEKPAAEEKTEPVAEKKADKKKEEPAEEKPVGGKEEEKSWGDVYDEPGKGAPPPTDPETGEVADGPAETVDTKTGEVTEEAPEEKPKGEPSKGHTMLEGAENVMETPGDIDDVAREIFPSLKEGGTWRDLEEDNKAVLFAELMKRTHPGR